MRYWSILVHVAATLSIHTVCVDRVLGQIDAEIGDGGAGEIVLWFELTELLGSLKSDPRG